MESGYSSDEDTFYRDEILKFKRSFKVIALIRKSFHGEIYLGQCRKTKTEVVLKVIKKNLKNEIRAHRIAAEVDPEGTTGLYAVFERANDFILAIEKPKNSLDILEIINIYGALNLATVKQVIRQIGRSCVRYKSVNLVHGDIKDENVLLDPLTGQTKIIDFGNAQFYGDEVNLTTGTIAYTPPEAKENGSIDIDSSIVYSLGCLAYIMLTASCPFGESFDFQRQVLLNQKLTLPEAKFLQGLLAPDPKSRAKLDQICQ